MLLHQRDLWADFRAIYHLSPGEALALPGPEYMALAYRVPAYQGVMAALLASEQEGQPAGSAAGVVDGTASAQDVPLGSRTPVADSDGGDLTDLFDIG